MKNLNFIENEKKLSELFNSDKNNIDRARLNKIEQNILFHIRRQENRALSHYYRPIFVALSTVIVLFVLIWPSHKNNISNLKLNAYYEIIEDKEKLDQMILTLSEFNNDNEDYLDESDITYQISENF